MDIKEKPPMIITVASIIGIILSILGITVSGWEPLFMLTIFPLLLCIGLLVKKWWVCGLLYCLEFLYVRSGMFLGKATALAIILNLIIVVIFLRATLAAYRYKRVI